MTLYGHLASFGGGRSSSPFPGGSITSYAWRWGDRHTVNGKDVSRSYAKKGT